MTKDEARLIVKRKLCENCAVLLGGGTCSDDCQNKQILDMLRDDVITIPDGATNGDMIKQLYDKTPTGVNFDYFAESGEMVFTTLNDWWNAPYVRKGNYYVGANETQVKI